MLTKCFTYTLFLIYMYWTSFKTSSLYFSILGRHVLGIELKIARTQCCVTFPLLLIPLVTYYNVKCYHK